ncbi:MAG: RNA methyltransferase, partial [Prevotella sp.]|nr:RNA methyltransferase [Prevotella sp.]
MISKNQIKYIRQLELKKYRKREGVYVAEGPKVVGDLLRRYQPVAVYATEEWVKVHGSEGVMEITDDELRRISFLQHPQQVLALFPIP